MGGQGAAGPLAAAPRTPWADSEWGAGSSDWVGPWGSPGEAVADQQKPEPHPRESPAAVSAAPGVPYSPPAEDQRRPPGAAGIDTVGNCLQLRRMLVRDLEVLETPQTLSQAC